MTNKADILGYRVEATSLASCSSSIFKSLDDTRRQCLWFACINPHSYALARRDVVFRNALQSAHLLLPDGIGFIIAGRLLGQNIRERITGFDMFEVVMAELNRRGGSVFFLGSTTGNLGLVQQRVSEQYPNIYVAGLLSPTFGAELTGQENEYIVNTIAESKADVLWVGMTAPKQEKWIADNRHRLPVKFAGPIGAVFDFYTGKVKRSHIFFQRFGLEWLPRLIQEPRRLWRRTFISAPVFMFDTLVARLTPTDKECNGK